MKNNLCGHVDSPFDKADNAYDDAYDAYDDAYDDAEAFFFNREKEKIEKSKGSQIKF
jgi:hypothetical protein